MTKLELLMRVGDEEEGKITYQGTETEFTITDIQPASLYYFSVRAVNKVGVNILFEFHNHHNIYKYKVSISIFFPISLC